LKPTIALTAGEPAGIGPELCCLLAQEDLPAKLVVIADRKLIAQRADLLDLPLMIRDFDLSSAAMPGTLEIIHVPLAAIASPGLLNPTNAQYVIATLDRAIAGAQAGVFEAMVTAPLQKSTIIEGGFSDFMGHTEYLAHKSETPHVVMMLVAQEVNGLKRPLRVALATTHLPLSQVPKAITPELLDHTLSVIDFELRDRFAISAPRILVAGLNPHAGEDGKMGSEEIDTIIPAITRAQSRGIDARGPYPADTLFTHRHLREADCVLAMYHDQGLPVLKHASFGHGVNMTLGLPFIRTSVDHGTALDLAGKGTADVTSLRTAIELAADLALKRRKVMRGLVV
jgi:4-hydroxythreonine-4-phosphate dehydrogenase